MKKFFILAFTLKVVMMSGQELQNFRPQQVISPEIANGKVTFRIFAPQAYQVRLFGSWMASYTTSEPLARDTAGVWSVTINTPAPEIYTYNFIVDGVTKGDDANIFVQRDGRRLLSVLLIDGPLSANYREANKRGNLNQVWYDSPTLGMTRRMFVYTPYGYATSKQKYPVLYLHHGGGGDEDAWSNMGRTCQILDNLIEQGKAVPMIVVMPNGNANQQAAQTLLLPEKTSDRSTPADLYNQSLVKDIIPYIDSHYRVIANAKSRAISGLSMGGGQTFNIGLRNLNLFSAIGVFSSGMFGMTPDANYEPDPEIAGILSNVKKIKNSLNLFYMSCGTSDPRIEPTRRVVQRFRDTGLDVVYVEFPDGHEWSFWRRTLQDFVQKIFKPTVQP